MRSLAMAAALAAMLVDGFSITTLPSCAYNCFDITSSGFYVPGCDSFDYGCMCTSDDFIASWSCCIDDACNGDDVHAAAAYVSSFCQGIGVTLSLACSTDASSTDTAATATASDPSSSSGNSTTTTDSAGSDQDVHTMVIGLGVGLGVGVPLTLGIAGLLAFCVWRTKRKTRSSLGGGGGGGGDDGISNSSHHDPKAAASPVAHVISGSSSPMAATTTTTAELGGKAHGAYSSVYPSAPTVTTMAMTASPSPPPFSAVQPAEPPSTDPAAVRAASDAAAAAAAAAELPGRGYPGATRVEMGNDSAAPRHELVPLLHPHPPAPAQPWDDARVQELGGDAAQPPPPPPPTELPLQAARATTGTNGGSVEMGSDAAAPRYELYSDHSGAWRH